MPALMRSDCGKRPFKGRGLGIQNDPDDGLYDTNFSEVLNPHINMYQFYLKA